MKILRSPLKCWNLKNKCLGKETYWINPQSNTISMFMLISFLLGLVVGLLLLNVTSGQMLPSRLFTILSWSHQTFLPNTLLSIYLYLYSNTFQFKIYIQVFIPQTNLLCDMGFHQVTVYRLSFHLFNCFCYLFIFINIIKRNVFYFTTFYDVFKSKVRLPSDPIVSQAGKTFTGHHYTDYQLITIESS